jgi:hypothetical protein
MAISVHSEGGVTVVAAVGTYEVSELQASVSEAAAGAETPFRLLFDLRLSDSVAGRSTSEIRRMAAHLKSLQSVLGPRVAVVTSGGLAYGLMRMGSVYAEDEALAVCVFSEMDSARDWLCET